MKSIERAGLAGLLVATLGCEEGPPAVNPPNNVSHLRDAGPERIYPECQDPVDFNPEACGTWRYSKAQVRRVGLREFLPSTWPDHRARQEGEVEEMPDITLTIAPPPVDWVACGGERCFHHCDPEGFFPLDPFARPLARDIYPLFAAFVQDPSAWCAAELGPWYEEFFYTGCVDNHSDDEEAFNACIDTIETRVGQVVEAAIADASACLNVPIIGPRDALLVQPPVPTGRFEVDQLTSNDCSQQPNELCRPHSASLTFDRLFNWRVPGTERQFNTAIDSQECRETNRHYIDGGEPCHQCYLHNPFDGSIEPVSFLGTGVPTLWVPVVKDDSRDISLPPECIQEDRLTRWRELVSQCAAGTDIHFVDEQTAAPRGTRPHRPGRWIPMIGPGIKALGPLTPGQSVIYWAFEGSGTAFSKPPEAFELVNMARCLALAYQDFLDWKLDHDRNGRCDGIECPEIVSPTGDPTLSADAPPQPDGRRYDPSAEIVFSPHTSRAEFDLVVSGVTDPEAVRVRPAPLPDFEGPIEAIVGPPRFDPMIGEATWRIEYPRMPVANSAFGLRPIEVCVPQNLAPDCGQVVDGFVCKQQPIEVFWPKVIDDALPQFSGNYASNHGGMSASRPLRCETVTQAGAPISFEVSGGIPTPNWFHFWLQVAAERLGPEFDPSTISYSLGFEPVTASGVTGAVACYIGGYSGHRDWVWLAPRTALHLNWRAVTDIVPVPPGVDAATVEGTIALSGIDRFIYTLRHELMHVEQVASYGRTTALGGYRPDHRVDLASPALGIDAHDLSPYERDWSFSLPFEAGGYNHYHFLTPGGIVELASGRAFELDCDLNGDGVAQRGQLVQESDIDWESLTGPTTDCAEEIQAYYIDAFVVDGFGVDLNNDGDRVDWFSEVVWIDDNENDIPDFLPDDRQPPPNRLHIENYPARVPFPPPDARGFPTDDDTFGPFDWGAPGKNHALIGVYDD